MEILEGLQDAPGLGGYVLAGGRSSRMGQDKAVLELGGRPLIQHAVTKLRRLTGQANILAGEAPGNPDLAAFGPLVFDTHPGCGPMGGIEAALQHSPHEWNLILPVDVPFLPAAALASWLQAVIALPTSPAVALFSVDGVPQPTLLLIRRAALPLLALALERGEYKLYPALREAAVLLAPQEVPLQDRGPYVVSVDNGIAVKDQEMLATPVSWPALSEAQRSTRPLWFANLNNPAEFVAAQSHVDALDTF